MPSFLDSKLAVIAVEVGVSSAFQEVCDRNMDAYSLPRQALALIDTGASVSIVDLSVINHLLIAEKERTSVCGFIGDPQEFPTYDVSLKVLNRSGEVILNESDFRVVGANLKSNGYDAIIGMDLLHSFTLRFLHQKGLADIRATTPDFVI